MAIWVVAPGSPGAERAFLRISIQEEVFHFFGSVKDDESAVMLERLVREADTDGVYIDEIMVGEGATNLPEFSVLVGLLMELSHSFPTAEIEIGKEALRLNVASQSEVALAAVKARLALIERTGWKTTLQMGAKESAVTFVRQERPVATRKRPEFEETDAVALAAEILAETEPVVAVAPIVSNDPEEGAEDEQMLETAAPVVKPKGPGISFAPDSFVLQGAEIARAKAFGKRIAGRDDLLENAEMVVLRVSSVGTQGEANDAFRQWLVNERIDAVKRVFAGAGAETSIIKVEQTSDPEFAINHVEVVIPPEPLVEIEMVGEIPTAHRIEASRVSSLPRMSVVP